MFHHPTALGGLHNNSYENIFTASRFDGPKYLDLLIKAYRKAGVMTPLRIAGSGPQEPGLRELAQGCDSIHFLGRLTDSELKEDG